MLMVVNDDDCVVSFYDMLPFNLWCSMLGMSFDILVVDTQLLWIAARLAYGYKNCSEAL